MNDDSLLRQELEGRFLIPERFPSTYSEVKSAYKDLFGDSWIGPLAQDLTGSPGRSGKDYRSARRVLEKFEKGTTKSMRRFGDESFEKLGKTLPAFPPRLTQNQVTLTIRGKQQGKDRKAIVTIKGEKLLQLLQNPTWGDVWDEYPAGDILEDGEYEMSVSSVSAA